MLAQLLCLAGQSLFFIFGVYIQKYIRHKALSKQQGKKIKISSRSIICSLVTILLLLFNYSNYSSQQSFGTYFYLKFNPIQIVHVLVANSILFGVHIYEKFIKHEADFSRYTIKSLFIAPLLEELLFRAAFYRLGQQIVPNFIIAMFFSLSKEFFQLGHVHKSLRKKLKGKSPNWKSTISQIIFTYIFGLYSFYFLSQFNSVLPSIILHCYCNFLGPPSINKTNLKFHVLCIIGIFTYCTFII